MKQSKKTVTKPREVFEKVRNQRDDRFNLRVRLTLLVSAELVGCALISACVWMVLPSKSPAALAGALFLISLLIGAGITSLLAKQFFDPIKKLGKAMEKIADGDYSVRLEEVSSSKEIMEIYTGFNLMAHELGSTEMLQSDFISNVSHEFKTPINAIEGYSMLLQGSDNLDPDQSHYVDKIVYNTQRLSSLVGSILLLSRLDNQQIPKNQTRYRLDEQIRQSIVALETEWEPKEIEFDVEMDCIEYVGNEPMMRHVWNNLIGNAIKFDPPCGLIRIRLTQTKTQIHFTIEDSGPGFPDEAQKHLYDKFYQADSSHKQEGNGLGLALVSRILTLEKGSIQAENLTGGGCRFCVTLKK